MTAHVPSREERLAEGERSDLRYAIAHWHPNHDEGSRVYEVVEQIITARVAAALVAADHTPGLPERQSPVPNAIKSGGQITTAPEVAGGCGTCTCHYLPGQPCQEYERGHIEGYEKGLLDPSSAWMTNRAQIKAEALREVADDLDDHTDCECEPGDHLTHLTGSLGLRDRADRILRDAEGAGDE